MRRVLVLGCGGAGKTTLARRIAAQAGLPLVHLDTHFWQPQWVPSPPEAWEQQVAALTAQPDWVIDGNYSGTLSQRLEACDMVVLLDLPRRTCLWRVVKRWLQYRGRSRPELPAGCPERLHWSFIRWIWSYPRRTRALLLRQLEALAGEKRVVVLRSQAEVERFMATFSGLVA